MSDTPVFVPAHEADAPVIAGLRQRCWAAAYRSFYPDEMIDHFDHAWHAARDRARIRDDRCIVRLILLDSEAIGYIILRTGDEALLMSLYILPEHHRQGVGTAAFRHAQDTFRRLGYPFFICHCLPQNTSARAFYEHMGGTVSGWDTGNPEPWQDSVIYRFPC